MITNTFMPQIDWHTSWRAYNLIYNLFSFGWFTQSNWVSQKLMWMIITVSTLIQDLWQEVFRSKWSNDELHVMLFMWYKVIFGRQQHCLLFCIHASVAQILVKLGYVEYVKYNVQRTGHYCRKKGWCRTSITLKGFLMTRSTPLFLYYTITY